METRYCYSIEVHSDNDDGTISPMILKENDAFQYFTDIVYTDIADVQEQVDKLNELMGLTKEDVKAIRDSSIMASFRKDKE